MALCVHAQESLSQRGLREYGKGLAVAGWSAPGKNVHRGGAGRCGDCTLQRCKQASWEMWHSDCLTFVIHFLMSPNLSLGDTRTPNPSDDLKLLSSCIDSRAKVLIEHLTQKLSTVGICLAVQSSQWSRLCWRAALVVRHEQGI